MTTKLPASRAAVRLDPLVMHLIYGDIEEMPLQILGDECPTNEAYNKMDAEQCIRVAAAATVQAWIERRLHKGGYIWDEGRHRPEDLVHNKKHNPTETA